MTSIQPASKLAEFFKTSQHYVYKKGATVLRSGDVPSGVYYLESGYIKAYNLNVDGTENIILILKPGEIFPQRWAHTTNGETQFDALTSVVLRRKTHEAFEEFLDTHIDALREVHDLSLDIVEVLINRIDNLELTTSYARIINRLLFLAKRLGEIKDSELIIAAPITHGILANSINMSRETASRELEKIKKKGLIEEKSHIFIIKNQPKLELELHNHLNK